MEVYDVANKLAREIKESKQYLNLKKAKEELMNDQKKKQIKKEYEELKKEGIEFEIKRQENKEIDEKDKKEKLVKMYNVLIENKDIKEYFDYEIAFNQMMIDINKIIGSSIKDVL